MLNSALKPVEQLYQTFSSASPFKHISIDGFLEPHLAEQLLQQFPSFDAQRAKNEMGKPSGKATREDVRALGSAYQKLDDFFSSPNFLSYLSSLTGIPELLYDPEYFGGGTHDNQHGQELDVHVDFNYHRSSRVHRRLNLIVYLNHEWDLSWGGNIELHSNPRDPNLNQITQFAPLFNRCVIFETNEISWHGFAKINLPEEKRHLSRKSMTVYYYTKDRPAHEIVPPHNTFYIQRPLPPSVHPGHTLTQSDVSTIQGLIGKRDTWLQFYQNLELRLNGEIGGLKHYLSEILSAVRPQTVGYFLQRGAVTGYDPDRWIGQRFEGTFVAQRDIHALSLTVRTVDSLPQDTSMRILINGEEKNLVRLPSSELITIKTTCNIANGSAFTLSLESSHSVSPKELGINSDERRLVCLLEMIYAHHE